MTDRVDVWEGVEKIAAMLTKVSGESEEEWRTPSTVALAWEEQYIRDWFNIHGVGWTRSERIAIATGIVGCLSSYGVQATAGGTLALVHFCDRVLDGLGA